MTNLVPAPQIGSINRLVLDAVNSIHSRRAYGKALDEFFRWFASAPHDGFGKATVQAYRSQLERQGLAPSTINLRMSAIRKLASEAADNGLLPPELAAGIGRVKGVKQAGVRVGNWLTRDQAGAMLLLPNAGTRKGKRDRALLAVLIGAGLRRDEAAALTFEHIQQRDGRWVIADLVGKGKRVRTVPIPPWTKAAMDCWAEAAALSSGPVFRAVNKGGKAAEHAMTPQAIFQTVKEYAARLGVAVGPHDLRRTFAKLAHKGRAPLEQIQLSLGHASILTTERYLGVNQDLTDAPCDHLGLSVQME